MSWEARPTPDVNPETERYWAAAADDRLLVRECTDCGLVHHYPRTRCPDCFGDAVEWREADGTGTVYSYSTARMVSSWPDDDLPLVVAYVELNEGPRIVTNLDCDPADVEIGTRATVRFVDTEDGDVDVPVFVPADQ